MDEATQGALFHAAVDGDLAAVERFFIQSSTALTVDHVNTAHRQARERAFKDQGDVVVITTEPHELQTAGSWYFYNPSDSFELVRGCLFELLIENDRLHVLEWFFSAAACKIIEDTMRGLIVRVSLAAINWDSMEAIEILLDSHLFVEVLSSQERKLALQDILDHAFGRQCVELVRLLVAHGVDINSFCTRTAGFRSYVVHHTVKFVEELTRSGLLSIGYESLGSRLAFQSAGTALAIIKSGVEMQSEPDGWSPLHIAVNMDSVEIAEVILIHSAVDVNTTGTDLFFGSGSERSGVTPPMVASPKVAPLLLAYGAGARMRDSEGKTVLHYVTEDPDHKQAFKLFLQLVPELINTPDKDGTTPLLLMVCHPTQYNTESLEILLESGADPYAESDQGVSPYQWLMENAQGRTYVESHSRFFPSRP
ncbi:hypothetical protein Poli38472_012286 [Pythium oligandrum]|uniref:Uncharacterized protein n=1 Tax=Pythium oligandrum TaxID=41045 RepID=A0A8K1FKJ1_PYTOL|nr:hypothetical protein Poli38472_012286 [Pythium oligandrum]|eukprot:TMW67170.1 hypothetical protein Poli38472_012286 [Pythium oligandrum]